MKAEHASALALSNMSSFRFTPAADSASKIYVYHDHRPSESLAAGDYTNHKEIDLPAGALSLEDQLHAAPLAIARWQQRCVGNPLGQVIGFELASTATVSVFLNEEGEFSLASDPLCAAGSGGAPRQFVIGHREEDFCSIVSDVDGESADDQDLFYARRFSSVGQASAAAGQIGGSVFAIYRQGGAEILHELTVDPALAEAMPWAGCYQVTDQLMAGSTFLHGPENATRLEALERVGVTSVVSLIDPTELRTARTVAGKFSGQRAQPIFNENYFAVSDRTVPSPQQMHVILDVIDGGYLEGEKIFLHCYGGRGRTGTVIGCWLNRHGITQGKAALDRLTELRFACGLFTQSPETEEQRRMITRWREGD